MQTSGIKSDQRSFPKTIMADKRGGKYRPLFGLDVL